MMSVPSRSEKPTPQQSEVLKALQDQDLLNSGVAGMAELQEDRTESMNNIPILH